MNTIPCAVPNLIGNEKKYLSECIDTNYVSSVGEFVNRFEVKLTELSGTHHAVPTNTGTSAISLALLASGVNPSDLVIAPSYTFIATANAIVGVGADPFFVDIEQESWCISPEAIDEAIANYFKVDEKGELRHKFSGRRLAAVIAVFTLGHSARIDEISKTLKRYGLPLIVDAAAALGVEYKGEKLGALGDFQTLSFNGNKTFTSGGGGAVLTRNDHAGKLIRHLSSTARTGIAYQHDMVGFNYRMPNLNAAVGLAQLELYDNFLARKREIFEKYSSAFRDTPLGLLPDTSWCKSSHWLSGVRIPRDYHINASSFIIELAKNGIEAKPFWKPMHLQIPYKSSFRSSQTITDGIWDSVVILPCSTSLTKENQEFIIEKVLHIAKN
jgi:perosamine synthetase